MTADPATRDACNAAFTEIAAANGDPAAIYAALLKLARAPQSVDVPEELRRLSEAAGPDAWHLGAVYGSNDETIATVGYLTIGDECDVTFDGQRAPERAELAVVAVNFVRALIARSAEAASEERSDG